MGNYISDEVKLTYDETKALLELIQLIIRSITKYYYTDAKEELDSMELIETDRSIEKWWDRYDKIILNKFEFDNFDFVKDILNDLDFEIFSAIYLDSYEIDNPIWLYNVMRAWYKMYSFIDRNKCFHE